MKNTGEKLGLSKEKIARARELANEIAKPIQDMISCESTVTVERASLRLLGADGVNADGVPVPNLIVQQAKERLTDGACVLYVNGLLQTGMTTDQLNLKIAEGLNLTELSVTDKRRIQDKGRELAEESFNKIDIQANTRKYHIEKCKNNENSPLQYVIVATGNIYEDVNQAVAAVQQGADIIAVIRTTAQSLLDYVPYGTTTEGFGGTYATQANFRMMRYALDAEGEKIGKYIRLVNYCSGLCMPEIAAMGALERLDMMLNDSMYGILFRDINAKRTLIDQNFSRMINSYADIVINTGEDNYLTTSDAVENAHTVLASQFINERFALDAGLPSRLQGLGHAYEIDPRIKDSFLLELSQAQMAREIFPEAPLKYMPPTKHMDGNIFKGLVLNQLFNFVSKATEQSIHLLGMMTEAIHTPHIQDRYMALSSSKMVMNSIEGLSREICFSENGIIRQRAEHVLDHALAFLEETLKTGLFQAIEKGRFAVVKRPFEKGKGREGVFKKSSEYWNPVENYLKYKLDLGKGVMEIHRNTAEKTDSFAQRKPSEEKDKQIAHPNSVKAYGDTLNDGFVQLSFTLPMKSSARTTEAAKAYVAKMGFASFEIVHEEALGDEFTLFVVYARSLVAVNPNELIVDDTLETCPDMNEIDGMIRDFFGRKLVVVGACTGSDAHTVGIDAIMNMKGYDHHYGLERYSMIDAYNLGAQVPNEELISEAVRVNADAILVSQVVTQKDVHLKNLTELIELLEAEQLRDRFLLVVGGPRISQRLAIELGYDAGFGKGCFAEHVAYWITSKLQEKSHNDK